MNRSAMWEIVVDLYDCTVNEVCKAIAISPKSHSTRARPPFFLKFILFTGVFCRCTQVYIVYKQISCSDVKYSESCMLGDALQEDASALSLRYL
jgi:hypothetical protein